MANIGLLTNDVAHNAATSCRDALVAGGHTVTLISDSSVGTHDYTPYDLVVTSRTYNTWHSSIAAKLNELNNARMPLIVGTVEAGLSAGTGHSKVPTEMGITGLMSVANSAKQIQITDNLHPVTNGVATGINDIFLVNNYMGAVDEGQSYIGTSLALGYSAINISDLPTIIGMEAGTPRLNEGTPLGARIVMFPTYLISGAYTELHRTLLNQAVNWALSSEEAYEPPPPPEQVEASKLVGYAVMGFPEGHVGSSKLTAYAVMDLEHAQVYSSKLVAYAIMNGEYVPPEPIKPRVGDTLGHQGDVWENDPTSFLNQWQRNQVDISGATNPTYLLVPADEGTMIRNRLIGVNEFGQSDPVFSAEVGPVEAAEPATSSAVILDTTRAPDGYEYSDGDRKVENVSAGSTNTRWAVADRIVPRDGTVRYWEIVCLGTGQANYDGYIGAVVESQRDWGAGAGQGENSVSGGSWGYRGIGSFWAEGGSQASLLPTYGRTDLVMIAFNPTTGEIWVGSNGVWDSNPSSQAASYTTAPGTYYPYVMGRNTNEGGTLLSLESQFVYDAPAGTVPLGNP